MLFSLLGLPLSRRNGSMEGLATLGISAWLPSVICVICGTTLVTSADRGGPSHAARKRFVADFCGPCRLGVGADRLPTRVRKPTHVRMCDGRRLTLTRKDAPRPPERFPVYRCLLVPREIRLAALGLRGRMLMDSGSNWTNSISSACQKASPCPPADSPFVHALALQRPDG